ncbi:MAG TPA: hypothetical protein VNR17_03790 [Luteimicrobium sp.]|nr:hypothetical protein [Luteimicrobium sp.]
MLTWGSGPGNRDLVLDGTTVGRLDREAFRERATVQLGPETWQFARGRGGVVTGTGPWGAPVPHQLWARPFSAWRYGWEVVTPVARYELRGGGAFGGGYPLLRDGVQIGEARTVRFFSSRFAVLLPPDVPLPDQAFLLWVAQVAAGRTAAFAAFT